MSTPREAYLVSTPCQFTYSKWNPLDLVKWYMSHGTDLRKKAQSSLKWGVTGFTDLKSAQDYAIEHSITTTSRASPFQEEHPVVTHTPFIFQVTVNGRGEVESMYNAMFYYYCSGFQYSAFQFKMVNEFEKEYYEVPTFIKETIRFF